jgi:uncharacterized membrane protein YfhO
MNDRLKKLMNTDVRFVSHEYLWAAFLLPVFLLSAVFFSLRIHPVGDNSLLTVDLFHQYAPVLVEFRRKILAVDNLFFSWNIGLGSNFWPVIAYYSASPLNFIVLLFPEKNISDAIAVMVLLRTGLSGLFFSLMILGKDKKEGPPVLALSTLYALNGFVLSYFWNVMWMDAIVLLPLVVLGLWRLFTEKKMTLYIVTLFLTILSNFYFGLFVCLFLIIFFFILYIEARQKKQAQPFWISFLRFAGGSLLAVMMTAFLILPTVLALTKTSAATGQTEPTLEMTFSFFDFVSRFLLHADPVVRDGLPNVFCGVLILLLVPIYLLCSGIPFRRRFATACAAAFLFVSMANLTLNFVWHGMHQTNQIPYRQAFVLIFLLLYAASDVLSHIDKINRNSVFAAAFLSLGYLILLNRSSDTAFDPWLIYGSAFLVVAYAITLIYLLRDRKIRERAEKALLYLVILEVFLSAEFSLGNLAEKEAFTYYSAYAPFSSEISEEIATRDDGAFARSALVPIETGNDGALFNLKTITYFLSTTRQSTVTFLGCLGFANNTFNEISANGLTEVSARLLGIKHVITYTDAITVDEYIGVSSSDNQILSSDLFQPERDKLFGGFEVKSDEKVLPVAYAVPSSGISYKPDPSACPFDWTNALLREMGGTEVYREVERSDTNLSNLTLSDQKDLYSVISTGSIASYTFHPVNYESGRRLYLFVDSNDKIAITVTSFNKETGDRSQEIIKPLAGQIIDCGILPPNEDELSVRVSLSESSSSPVRISTVSVDAAALDEITAKLGSFSISDVSYRSGSISGSITLPADSHILFTIPYDEGWTVNVDGQRIETETAYGALLAVPASAGVHQVDLHYSTPGFDAGTAVTIGAFLIFSGTLIFRRFPPKKRKEEEQTA